jgi:hypothetical protein
MEGIAQIFAIKEDLYKVERKLEQKINETKVDLIQWMVTLWILQNLLILFLFLKK